MKTGVLITLFFLGIISQNQAGNVAVDVTSGLSGLGGGITGGYEFEVTDTNGIVVDGLGFWDDQVNGFLLSQTFPVGLWETGTGTLMRSTVVNSASALKASANASGGWRVNAVSPVFLAPGFYRLGGVYPDLAANPTVIADATFQVATGINLVQPLRHIGTTLTMPDIGPPSIGSVFAGPVFTFLPGPYAAPVTVVAPSNYLSVAGNGGLNTLVRSISAPRTSQMQFTPAVLGGLPVGARITELRFRLSTNNLANFPTVNITWPTYEVIMAQAANSVAGMSTNFSANMVSPTIVKSGSLSISADNFTFGNNPNLFGPAIIFDTPYVYQGGDLVIHVTHNGSDSSATAFLDAASSAAPGYGTTFRAISANSFGAASGTTASLTIAQIVFTPTIKQAISLAGTNVIINGSGGLSGLTYKILTASNATLPVVQWTPVYTNQFLPGGIFSYTNTLSRSNAAKYFRTLLP